MTNFPDIRFEVLVDGPLVPRVLALAEAAGITRYMLLATQGGRGRNGRWRRDEVTGTTAKQLFVAIMPAEKAESFSVALAPLLETLDLLVITSPAASPSVG
jgi:hypothetical protein